MLLTDVDIERMRALINSEGERALGGLDRLVANGSSDAGYVPARSRSWCSEARARTTRISPATRQVAS